MKSISLSVLIIHLFLFLISCQNAEPASSKKQAAKLTIDSTELYPVNLQEMTKDWKQWYNYTYYQVRLSQNFIGYDQDSTLINKQRFLQQLATGKYIVLKVAQIKNAPVYKLYPAAEVQEDIRNTTKQMAETAIALSKMEGRQIPDFHFTDLAGKSYDKKSTRGKLMVIKCWFIHCVACVKEFPVLNSLVEKYKDRPEVQFLSLASDSKQDLVTFLAKKEFRYAVVPEAASYMNKDLAITAYPTHLLVDRNGIIKKVTNAIEDLLPSLEEQVNYSYKTEMDL